MLLYELIDHIARRPHTFVFERTINCLHSFLYGWLMAGNPRDVEFLNGFQKWIQDLYHIETTQSWAQIIWFVSTDQTQAFDKGVALLMVYRDQLQMQDVSV